MALATEKLGSTYAGEAETVDAERALAYAAATNDENPASQCASSARWDLCGGPPERAVPTAIYKDASGDDNAIHIDPTVATAVGLPGIIVHGLCTMAMTSQAVITTVAGGDPARLRRLAVRFSRPVFPGSDVVNTLYDAGPGEGRHLFAFEAHSGDELVISNGRAEVSP